MEPELRAVMGRLSQEFEGQAEAVLRISGEEHARPALAAALAAVADVLSAVAFGFTECAEAGTAEPLADLGRAATDWLDSRTDFAVAESQGHPGDIHPHEILRLADDGNPHAVPEAA